MQQGTAVFCKSQFIFIATLTERTHGDRTVAFLKISRAVVRRNYAYLVIETKVYSTENTILGNKIDS